MDRLPLWLLSCTFFVFCLLGIEAGHHWGKRAAPSDAGGQESAAGFVLGAHLGLVSFLLVITFGASMARLDMRRRLVVDEANAIGTAELRSRFLPSDAAASIRRVLIDYAELRAVFLPAGHVDLEEVKRRSDELKAALWRESLAAVERGVPDPPILALLLAASNEVIDTGARREYVLLQDRIPSPIWIVLLLVSVTAFVTLGYHQGSRGSRRRSFGIIPLALALGMVLGLIEDLDRPSSGWSRVDQSPLLSTLQEMQRYDRRAAAP